jgi:hypothetical protein
MSQTVRLHPAVIAVGVVVVGQLLGIVGLFVAVPIISLISDPRRRGLGEATGGGGGARAEPRRQLGPLFHAEPARGAVEAGLCHRDLSPVHPQPELLVGAPNPSRVCGSSRRQRKAREKWACSRE